MMQNKKVLFVCQYFYPETFHSNDVSFHLAHEGYDVHGQHPILLYCLTDTKIGLLLLLKAKYMYSYNDFERLFSVINQKAFPLEFQQRNSVCSTRCLITYFEKWYKDTRKKLILVQVLVVPLTDVDSTELSTPNLASKPMTDMPVLRIPNFVYWWIFV